CAMALAQSVRRNRQRAADRAAQLDGRAHRNLLVAPWIPDVGLEGDAAAEIDVVAQRVAEIRGKGDPALEVISLAAGPAVQRDVLGAYADHASVPHPQRGVVDRLDLSVRSRRAQLSARPVD